MTWTSRTRASGDPVGRVSRVSRWSSVDAMPLCNRATPRQEVIADPARGLVYANRGVLVNARGEIRRRWGVRRWIACRLEFRGRHRVVMSPGTWTELFFLDEATAFAAGHVLRAQPVDHLGRDPIVAGVLEVVQDRLREGEAPRRWASATAGCSVSPSRRTSSGSVMPWPTRVTMITAKPR